MRAPANRYHFEIPLCSYNCFTHMTSKVVAKHWLEW